MRTWAEPKLEKLPGTPPPLYLRDTNTGELRRHSFSDLHLWVCGITPYDATHLGHANTYVFFDILARTWRDSGRVLRYAQNLTDIDDPLFERAAATGVYWKDLAAAQTQLFREDMEKLRVIPPQDWVSVSEALPDLMEQVEKFRHQENAYELSNANGSTDIYISLTGDTHFAAAPIFSNMDLAAVFDAHGGDSTRPGKRDILDPLLWRGVRGADYSPIDLRDGGWRPGWHIECAVIAHKLLGRVDVQGGGADLIFPHHEMSEAHLRALSGDAAPVGIHMHSGLVAYQGQKMSKSLGNLVLVSKLMAAGEDPRAVRLAIIQHHYREDWEYDDAVLQTATMRLQNWQRAAHAPIETRPESAPAPAAITETVASENSLKPAAVRTEQSLAGTEAAVGTEKSVREFLQEIRTHLAKDLDTPRVLRLVDNYSAAIDSWESSAARQLFIATIDNLLGITL